MHLIEFPPVAEFLDRLGIVRRIAPCSLLGREEFKERLMQLQAKLEACESDWIQLYESDPMFQHIVQRCLQLNGIDPDWVTLPMVHQLLFSKAPDEPGWLISLSLGNTPEGHNSEGAGEGITAADLLGLLAKQHGIETAIRLGQTVPFDLLTEIMEAQAKWSNPDQAKPKPQKISAAELDRLLSLPVDQLQKVN